MSILEDIKSGLVAYNVKGTAVKVKEALEEGISPNTILDDALIAGMQEVGVKFRDNVIFLPEVILAAKVMEECMNILKPILLSSKIEANGKIIIGTVKGDRHDIGKNLVSIMLTGAGFEVIDLGKDVSESAFINAIKEHEPDILMLSALLTTTMPQQKAIIEALKKEGLKDKVKVMVGGAPVSEKFAEDIGADAYAKDAVSAVIMAKGLVNKL